MCYRFLGLLGLPVRWVVDWGDHVWVEVLRSGRWVHFDPCEGAVDEPLIYKGWGKTLTTVVGFREGEVVDRTRAYTDEPWEDVVGRRGEVDLDKGMEEALEVLRRGGLGGGTREDGTSAVDEKIS